MTYEACAFAGCGEQAMETVELTNGSTIFVCTGHGMMAAPKAWLAGVGLGLSRTAREAPTPDGDLLE